MEHQAVLPHPSSKPGPQRGPVTVSTALLHYQFRIYKENEEQPEGCLVLVCTVTAPRSEGICFFRILGAANAGTGTVRMIHGLMSRYRRANPELRIFALVGRVPLRTRQSLLTKIEDAVASRREFSLPLPGRLYYDGVTPPFEATKSVEEKHERQQDLARSESDQPRTGL